MTNKIEKIAQTIDELRTQSPLTHCITNIVTVRDCANAILAVGASPIMANEDEEAEEITSISNALVINIGTLTKTQIETMKKSANCAKENNKAFVLDPVGIGVSNIRNKTSIDLIKESKPTIIRGNLSEIKAIAKFYGILEECTTAKGVDVAAGDIINEETLDINASIVKNIAKKLDLTIAVSGPIDIISDGKEVYTINNGDSMLSKITGSGCMLGSIMGAYAAITSPLDAAICATLVMGISGEIAAEKVKQLNQGTGSFGIYLMDELYKISKDTILDKSNLNKIEQ